MQAGGGRPFYIGDAPEDCVTFIGKNKLISVIQILGWNSCFV